MLIPYQVDVPMERWPISNFVILGLMPIPFFLPFFLCQFMSEDRIAEIFVAFLLYGWSAGGLLGHMWLHIGLGHLLGNMLFLWLFGNAVCAKVGNGRYPFVYLSLGIIAAATHLIADGSPAVGASGAINGIVGMYVVMYPLNSISCFFGIFPWIRQFSLSGIWLILLWFLFDLWGAASGGEGIAYIAHIGGFTAGVLLAAFMLKSRLVEMNETERSLLEILGVPIGSPEHTAAGAVADRLEEERASLGAPAAQEGTMQFRCACGKVVKTSIKNAGMNARCPACKKMIRIPMPDE